MYVKRVLDLDATGMTITSERVAELMVTTTRSDNDPPGIVVGITARYFSQ
jgi:hypothetical protein